MIGHTVYHDTRCVILVCVSLVYFLAFSSILIQSKGLYGDSGILPIAHLLQTAENYGSENEYPILFLAHSLNLQPLIAFDLVCVVGIILSVLLSSFPSWFLCQPTMLILWGLYYSIVQVGQVFLHFQWDVFLLEVGFLSICYSPLLPSLSFYPFKERKQKPFETQASSLYLMLFRLLLFKVMFMSGVTKLESLCPTWWGLTALKHHFATQCIPTPLSWCVAALPDLLLKMGVAATLVFQVIGTIFYILPSQTLRLMAFFQVFLLMSFITLTGNYNFFTLLTLIVSFSLLDDGQWHSIFSYIPSFCRPRLSSSSSFSLSFSGEEGERKKERKKRKSFMQQLRNRKWRKIYIQIETFLQPFVTLFGILFFIYTSYSMLSISDFFLDGDLFVRWDEQILGDYVTFVLRYFLSIFVIIFCRTALLHLWKSSNDSWMRFWSEVPFVVISFVVLSICIVPLLSFDSTGRTPVPQEMRDIYEKTQPFLLSSPYGLFRRMTGVNFLPNGTEITQRPEVIIEGSMNGKDWIEYSFMYKVDLLEKSPVFVQPHQPRLDWQLWFQALRPRPEKWFINFLIRILENDKDVLDLIGDGGHPFGDNPPVYIKADIYYYDFSSFFDDTELWWNRKYGYELLGPIHLKHRQIQHFRKQLKVSSSTSPSSLGKWIESFVTTSKPILMFNFQEDLFFPFSLFSTFFPSSSFCSSPSPPPPPSSSSLSFLSSPLNSLWSLLTSPPFYFILLYFWVYYFLIFFMLFLALLALFIVAPLRD